jgi:hypothetical protein
MLLCKTFAAEADGCSRSEISVPVRGYFTRLSRAVTPASRCGVSRSGRHRFVACNRSVLPGTVSRVETSLSDRKQKIATRSTRNVRAHEFDGVLFGFRSWIDWIQQFGNACPEAAGRRTPAGGRRYRKPTAELRRCGEATFVPTALAWRRAAAGLAA